MDFHRFRYNSDRTFGDRLCGRSSIKEERYMSIVFAAAATPLACFMEGAVLGASVYLVSRGIRNPLKKK